MRTITRTAFAAVAAVALVGGSAMSASAADTTATVEVTADALSISAPAGVSLGEAAPGTTATAALGTTTVTDLTADTIGWASSVSVTTFTGGGTVIPTSAFSYTPGTATVIGTATVTSDDVTDVMTATDVIGNNTASWETTVGLAIPANALAGTYTGTITSSVL